MPHAWANSAALVVMAGFWIAGVGATPVAAQQAVPPQSISFLVIGHDAGLLMADALGSLLDRSSVGLHPLRVGEGQSAVQVLRDAYGLPEWVDLNPLVANLCKYNPATCQQTGDATPRWNIQTTPATAPLPDPNLCKAGTGDEKRPKQPYYLCAPDVTATLGTTFVTRIVKSDQEAEKIPDMVREETRGCVAFDGDCQRLVASRNATHLFVAGKVEDSGLFSANGTEGAAGEWWTTLTGDLTLPAAAVTISIPVKNEVALGGSAGADDSLCENVVRAVLDVDHRYRIALGVASNYTYSIVTDCRTVVHSREAPQQAHALNGRIAVSQAFADHVLADARSVMNLAVANGNRSGRPLLGVWDGPIAIGPQLQRPGAYMPLTLRPGLPNPAGSALPGSSVVSWIDPFPATGFGDPPGAPCGAPVIPGEPKEDHATVIASMLSGKTDGLLPNARVWSFIWDKRRLEVGGSIGPGASVGWFGRSVAEAPALGALTVANLSCGVSFDAKNETDAYYGLRANLVGIVDPSDAANVAPYVIGIAAGNHLSEGDPTMVDAKLLASGMPDVGGGGFPFLARNHATSGAISVVALGASGEEPLQCGDVRRVIQSAAQAGFKVEEGHISSLCPVTPDEPDDFSDSRPLAIFGTAFDVGAVGIGAGDGTDGKPLVMWGSSFATPYVTGLAAQVLEKARTVTNKVLIPANYVADRIRFTADTLGDGSTVLYGRINGRRALDFEHDQFEMSQLDGSSEPPTADKVMVQQCEGDGGRVELDRKVSGMTLPLADGTTIPLRFVQRIREVQQGRYEEIDRGPQDSPSTYSLTTRHLAGTAITIPVVCMKNKIALRSMRIHVDALASFTRCSFMGSGCDF